MEGDKQTTDYGSGDGGKIFGSYTRDLYSVFKKYDNNEKIQSCNLRKAFNDLDLYPSHSQIQEMVHCAVEYGSPCDADHVTFGEFSVLVDELQHYYAIGASPALPKSVIKNKSAGFVARRARKESLANFQVFLGGSCGCSMQPSRWRSETAIPFLKKENITFYNPQVNTWRPELVELEDKAKNLAALQFFMIDNNTRSVVAVCEIAYLVGCGRQIIVVFTNFSSEVEEVAMEKTSEREREDIMRARNVLMDIIERNGIPVFQDLESALGCAAIHLKQGVKVQDLTVSQGALPVKHGHVLVGEALLKLRESFNSITGSSDGLMSREDIGLGYRCYTGGAFSLSWLQHQRPAQTSFSFEEFCCIVTEYKRRRPSVVNLVISRLAAPFTWLLDKLKGEAQETEVIEEVYDVYLGGSCGVSNWREEIAIPMLRREGVSYLNPLVTKWSDHLIPMQAAEREKCRVLLFVITDCTRAIGAMVESVAKPRAPSLVDYINKKFHGSKNSASEEKDKQAEPVNHEAMGMQEARNKYVDTRRADNSPSKLSNTQREKKWPTGQDIGLIFRVARVRSQAGYYIGCGCRVILCLENLQPDVAIEGEQMTERAMTDYNRGRIYLSDVASREGVPVFQDVRESIESVVRTLRKLDNSVDTS